MARRYFNLKLAIVLVLTVAVLGLTAFGLRQWQRSRRAKYGLDAGIKAYNQKRWEEAASNLGRYLALERDNVPILLKYANAQLNIRPLKPNNIQQAIAAYRTVLRTDKSPPMVDEAAIRLTKIYLGLDMPGEAELIATRHIQTNKDPELRRLLALALARQRKFNEASVELKAILQEYPEQVLAYETLGQLIEQRPEDFPEPATYWFNQAIRNNPSSALAYISRAGFYLRSKNKTKALADLKQAEKLDLSDPHIRLRLANEFINVNVLDKAEEHLEAVQQTIPTDQTLWQTWAQLALKSRSQEKMLKVAKTGLKQLSSQPWDFMPIATELFIATGQLDQASDCISKLRQKNISPATVAFLEGAVANQKGHTYQAIKCWRRSIELGNKSSQTRLALASALSHLGDRQSALQQLRTLVSERPNFANGRLALAKLLAQTGNWTEAVEQARRAMQLSPENREAALTHLQAQINLLAARPTDENFPIWQDIEKQLAMLEKNADGAPDVKLLQFQLAIQQGDLIKAEALITQLRKANPSQVKIAIAESDLLVTQGKKDEAILTLSKTIEEFPKAVEPVKYLAILLDRQGEREKAKAVISNALTRIKQPVAQRDLGQLFADLYTRGGQEDNAYKFLDALSRKLPHDILIKRRLLACQQVIKNSEQAQQLIDEIKSLEGEDGWQWRYEQARVWFAADDFKDRYAQIISLLRENVLANPDDQASRMLLATAYERGGEVQLALSTYREALNRSPDDLRIVVPTVAALCRAQEYAQADEILSRASQEKLYNPQLQTLQLQSHLRRGQLGSASKILEEMVSNDPNNKAARFSLALVKMRENKFAEAEKLLAKLETEDPNSLAVAYAQVQLNLRQGKHEEALTVCNEMADNLDNASAYILRAKTYSTLGQTNNAAKDLEHATAAEPNNVEVWIARSQFYRSIGQPDLAAADIQQALSLAPNNVYIQKHAISLFLASGNPDRIRQGRNILDRALESNPEDTELRLFKARLLLSEGTAPAIENAERSLQKITEDRPEISDAWLLLGETLLRQGRPGKAIDTALRGLTHTPNDKTLLLLKARAEAARSPVLAIPTIKALHELDPNDIDIALKLADIYIAAGLPENAVKFLEEQLTLHKGIGQERKVNIALAIALYQNGNKAKAQEKFDFLLRSSPDDPSPLLAHVRLLRDDKLWSRLSREVAEWLQDHPQDTNTPITIAKSLAVAEDHQAQKIAEDLLRRTLDRDPNNLAAMYTLAMLLQMVGRDAESAEFYQQILKRVPDNAIAINNLAWVMCEAQGKYQQALQLAQRGLKIAPHYIDLIDTRGVVYYRLGKLNKAVQDFDTCIKLYPSVAPSGVASRFHLARAFAKLGQEDRALQHLNEALSLERRIGGLSSTDMAEAQRLLEQLQRKGD